MALRIRLRRMGRKKAPTYRIVVAESSMPRDGRFVANLGHYNPRTQPVGLVVDREQALHWMARGATPTDTARSLLRQAGVFKPETPVADAVESVTEAVKSTAKKAAGAAKSATKKAAAAVSSAAGSVSEAAGDAVEAVRDAAEDVVEAVQERVSGAEAEEAPAAEAPAAPAGEAGEPAEAAEEPAAEEPAAEGDEEKQA